MFRMCIYQDACLKVIAVGYVRLTNSLVTIYSSGGIRMKKVLILSCIISLTGCASIVSGPKQSVSVEAPPVSGATCTLSNNDGAWFVAATPGSVTINRNSSNLVISCKKDGKTLGTTQVPSSVRPLVMGNIVFFIVGGIIGTAIDMGTGAAYEYPTLITVPTQK